MTHFKASIPKVLKASKATLTVTVHATGLRRLRFGLWLIKLGARICGLKTVVEEKPRGYAYQRPDWKPDTCPCCGCAYLTVEQKPNSDLWSICWKCGLPASEWQKWMNDCSFYEPVNKCRVHTTCIGAGRAGNAS